MNKVQQVLLLFITIAFFNCKEKKERDHLSIEEISDKLTLKFEIRTEEDLDLKLYYCLDSIISFKVEKTIKRKVKASDLMQDVIFEIKEKSLPQKLKLVLESNGSESSVVFGHTHFNYNTQSFKIKPEGFWYNFNPNKSIVFNKKNNSFKISENDSQVSPPYFISRKRLDLRINSLQNTKKESIPKELLRDSVFRVFIDGTFKNNLNAEIVYNTRIKDSLYAIKKVVKKSPNEQRITFEIPKNAIPKTFKVLYSFNDLLNNDIEIKRIVINRNTNRIVIIDSALVAYFYLKGGFYYDSANKVVISPKDNNKEELFFETKPLLEQRILNRYQKN